MTTLEEYQERRTNVQSMIEAVVATKFDMLGSGAANWRNIAGDLLALYKLETFLTEDETKLTTIIDELLAELL